MKESKIINAIFVFSAVKLTASIFKKEVKSMKKIFVMILTVILLFSIMGIAAQKLIINSYMSDPAPKKVFAELVDQFRALHPDYKVVVNTFAHEDFKTLLRTWLNSSNAPDVVTWFAGERMRYFASKGLLEPIDDIFKGGFDSYFPSAFRSASEYKGHIYFVPQSWYWWGVYYRKSIFEKLGLKIPTTWWEFKQTCEKLKKAGYIPITIGTKYLWTAAGWFDYLDMRINGLDYHMKLTAGEIPYTDQGVKKVFEYWKQLVESGYFISNHTSYSWQEAANYLFTGKAAMYLMGQFIKDVAPESVKSDLDFFRFPIINGNVGLYEDTPIDGFMIPAKASHKDAAKVFLEFIASKKAQEYFASNLGRLAANKSVPAPDAHAQKGLNMIFASDGVMQFYDRDTNPEMATAGMNGFVEFMVYPNRVDSILKNLETQRERIYK
jgi:multiple sugar transport system substrate-binding protein